MGFRVKIAPGVRVGVSSRGVRASIGPRAARVHVGSGRTGFSTGVGPVSYYTSVGGSRRRTSAGRAPSLTQYERDLRRTQKEDELAQLVGRFDALLNVHRQAFPPAQRPLAPAPEPVDERPIRRRHRQEQLRGVSIFRLSRRRQAKATAAELAAIEIRQQHEARHAAAAEHQRALDEAWTLLCGNDGPTVMTVVESAFEDNQAAAAPIDCAGDQLTILMLAPNLETVPERFPGRSETGRPTFRKLTKTERNQHYTTLICGHALATVREALAVAPGITTVTVVVARRSDSGSLEAILAASFRRDVLSGADWNEELAPEIMSRCSDAGLVNIGGRTEEMRPLDLSQEPDLADLLRTVNDHLYASSSPG